MTPGDLVAKLCPTLVTPVRLLCPWNSPGKNTGVGCQDSKEIKSVNHNGNQPCIFIGRTDCEAEDPIFCPPDWKIQLIRKDPFDRKD
jgi:hypothetical protein